jgi:hypothetical protein
VEYAIDNVSKKSSNILYSVLTYPYDESRLV